jgi:ABC-type transporter Mla MlaB component
MSRSPKAATPNADSAKESVKSARTSLMSTSKAKRKRAARSVAASVEVAVPPAPSQPMIVLAANCNVKDAAELKQSLCLHLDQAAAVTLDVGGVERVDTSTIQLLCAFVRDRSEQRRKVEWLGDSRVVRDAARLLGVEALLCLPNAEVAR